MNCLVFPSLIILMFCTAPVLAAPADAPLSARIMAAQQEMAAQPLWPGFEPLTIPAAIYDGARTYLYGHPAPPEGFSPLAEEPEVLVYEGHHPIIRANTSVDLNGVRTATLMIIPSREEGKEKSPQDYAAVVLHEKFHVFQGTHHPDWQANEASLFVYPTTDADLLAGRRLETEALRRAVGSADDARAAAWARTALDLRRQRHEKLDEALATYERETELVEGTAFYIEYQAAGRGPLEGAPAGGFAPADVRRRAYSTGRWLALLLDRFAPGWKTSLSANKAYLDQLLAPVLAARSASAAEFSPSEQTLFQQQAREDVAELLDGKSKQRQEFLETSGPRLVVETGSRLWPAGFDPMNVVALPEAEVLHLRWLKLSNDHGSLEVMNRAALTVGAGEHPLFNGVRRVVVTGLAEAPHITTDEDGTTRVTATGFTATFHGAEVTREGATTRITIR